MKKLISLCLVLTLVLSMTACHGATQQAAFDVPDEFDTSKNYTISFWVKNDSNKTQVAVYKKAIADFEKCYPNIQVNLKLYTNYGTIYNDVITNISTGTTPNVCISYPDHIATYLTGENVVVPLDDLMTHKKYGLGGSALKFDGPTRKEIIPQFLAEGKIGEHYYAMPYMRSTEACYVNVDMVEKLGFTMPEVLTWDFVWQVSEAAMEKNANGTYKANGQSVLIPFIYKSTDNMMIQLLRQMKADYSTANGEIQIFNDTTRQVLKDIASHSKTGAFSTFKISGYPANFLNAGRCIFAVDSTAGATWMGSEAPLIDIADDSLVHFRTAVYPVPQVDPDNMQMISQGPSVCIFNKEDPQEVLASWLLVQFMLTNEVQISYSQTEGYVPVTSKAQNSEEYRTYLSQAGKDNDLHYDVKLKASQLLLDNPDKTFVTPVFNGSASLRDAAGQMIEEVTLSTKRKKTVNDDFIDNLYTDMTALYRLDSIEPQETDDLGPMPGGSKWLIGVLVGAWVCIGLYSGWEFIKKRKKA